jgi:hypothetical protein
MSVGWVAASVRARAMANRRVGRAGARVLAASASFESAMSTLTATPYGHDARLDQSLAGAQRAIVATVVWNLRVLAGWAPRHGVVMLRVLLGALEAANVEDHLRRLAGSDPPPPYRLGGLATAWPQLERTTSPGELRGVLAGSPWGDPGGETVRDVGLAMRTSWADRAIAAAPVCTPWMAGATALLLAREAVLAGRRLPDRAAMSAARVVGSAAVAARTLPELVAALSTTARWVLADVTDPADLWQAEAGWWRRIERDGFAWARQANPGPEVLVGAAAMMAADAWRARAALEVAARGGKPLEAFDAVA